ncbi:NRDE family protein [Salinilacihabitans rarus]|uniref:NRDE family protein n=1 Tax=Salinilacihabitans rarus TaxID=2961596 RepID=UPI0020C89523|nr:NRDE family protein [Salinilacihabitans rarus]
MCTLTLAWRVFEEAPVAVAANRDEALGRPSEPPGIYREEPLTVAPRDGEVGGTWIGVNEHGVFAGITNRWLDADLAGERSRGLLVADVLACESAREAAALVERETAEREYDGFNLVVADADDAVHLAWDGGLERTAFDPGVHVVVNVGVAAESGSRFAVPAAREAFGERQRENAGCLRRDLEPDRDEDASAWLDRAGEALGDHDYGVCVHGDGFGTRSSSLIELGDEVGYAFADGPPCHTPYDPVDLESHI